MRRKPVPDPFVTEVNVSIPVVLAELADIERTFVERVPGTVTVSDYVPPVEGAVGQAGAPRAQTVRDQHGRFRPRKPKRDEHGRFLAAPPPALVRDEHGHFRRPPEPFVPATFERSGSVSIAPLKDRHKGQTCYVVGKGPSLANIRASDFGPGPVLVLNEAIEVVQNLGLPNQVYSMQKDGCTTADPYTIPRPCDTCAAFGWQRPTVVNPYPGIVVLFSQHLSSWCLKGRANRYVFTDEELGYKGLPFTMSVLESVPLAKHFGAASIVMVSFDSLVSGDLGYFEEGKYTEDQIGTMRYNLEWVRPKVMAALTEFGPHSFYTPTERSPALPIRHLPMVEAVA